MFVFRRVVQGLVIVALVIGTLAAPPLQKTATATELVNRIVVRNTNMVSAGLGGLRGVGSGTITLAGVSGTVTKALLYWHGPTQSTDPAVNASVDFYKTGAPAAVAVTGAHIGVSNDNSWGFANSRAYRADVTATVAAGGNAEYRLDRLIKRNADGGVIADINGVSLIVFFSGDAATRSDVYLIDANDSNLPNGNDLDGWNGTLSDVSWRSGDAAVLTLHVSDGQEFGGADDDVVKLNGATIASGTNVFDGDSTPIGTGGVGNGKLWDIKSYNITAGMTVGLNSLILTTGVATDYLSLIVMAVSVMPTDLTGTAACRRTDGEVTVGGPLTNATVRVYSGTALVDATPSASATVDAVTGAFVISGLAPSSTYTLRYSGLVGSARFVCGVEVTTNTLGGGVAPASPTMLDRGNHSWRTAYPLTSGAPISDLVLQQGQSVWYKIPVAPGQQITVDAQGFSRDYQLVLYRDIGAILVAQTSGTPTSDDVRYIQAGVSPGDFGTESPGDFGTESPGDFGTESPGDFGTESPGEVTAQEYTSAINAAFVAKSFNTGLSPENVSRQTWNDTGYYYIRIFGRDGVYDPFTPLTVSATVGAGACAVALNSYAPTTTVTIGTTPRSLVLVDTSRLKTRAGGAVNAAALLTRLGTYGTVVDLAADTGVQSAMAQWLTTAPTCSAAANIAVNAIKGVIDRYRSAGGATALEFITIVGGDRVIPYRRVPDRSPKASEENYRPPLLDGSAGNASLRQAQVLTDDYYAVRRPAASIDVSVDLPDENVAIGRLVEHLEDVEAMLSAYDAVSGVNNLNSPGTKRALVTGYDFFADEANIIVADLTAAGPSGKIAVDTLIEAENLGPAHATAWTADDLRAKLAQRYEVIALNAHFASQLMRAADWSRFDASEIASVPLSENRYRNTLLLSSGCHSAYNVQGPDAIPDVTLTMDFPQAAARQGMVLVGGTGYQYGGVKLLNYTEILLTDLTRQLRYGSGPVSIGKALTAVKRDYRARYSELNLMDHKTLNELTLYGLPMWSIDLPSAGRLAPPSTAPVTGLTPATGATGLLAYKDFTPAFALTPNTVTGVPSGIQATYYTIDGGFQSAPFEPVLPRKTVNASAGSAFLARGVTLQSASYTDTSGVRPFSDVPATESRTPYPPFVSSVFHPLSPVGLNAREQLVLTPFQYVSTGTGPTGTARKYANNSITARVWYSSFSGGVPAALLAGPPVIHSIDVTKTGATSVAVSVRASGLGASGISGVQSVLATYTGIAGALNGTWQSLELVRGTSVTTAAGSIDTFTGTIATGLTSPEDVRLFIQAVGANALVTARTNAGAYYRVVVETATAPAPKASTALEFTTPAADPANASYGQRLNVSATLTGPGGTALAGKRVTFVLGGKRASGTTGVGGVASATVLVTPEAGSYELSATFAEDLTHLTSVDTRALAVSPAATAFQPQPLTPIGYSNRLFAARLVALSGTSDERRLVDQPVAIDVPGSGTIAAITDAYGRLVIDKFDLGAIPAGTYNITLRFCPGAFGAGACGGDTRYSATTLPLTIEVLASAILTYTSVGPQPAGNAFLRSTVVPESAGDLTQAKVRYEFVTDPSGPTPAPIDASVNASGLSVFDVSGLAAGVYPFKARVTGSFTSKVIDGILVIYDPSAGFVTGGGSITSPTGAYVPYPELTGHATFGFVSKYQKGTSVPGGDTEFQFKLANFNFKSQTYEWLVVGGARAQFKGVGTINGAGTYGFLLTAIDGQVTGGGGTDKFRIKIWDKVTGAVVYDNQVGAAEDSNAATNLAGGSIVINVKK